ncbi:MAG: hypothetical protein E6Q39_00610 [Crocinitomicaceae bacterium]|jgi:hypothetical protein|nr:MAG: hypothetical protein E6Q39_00610 [Crocinitomicaceae bacterium]
MKKSTIVIAMLVVLLSACKKEETTTNPAVGNWTIKIWDGATLVAPEAGFINLTNTTATTGTADFSLTYDGVLYTKETDDYTLSANNTVINFTAKTSSSSTPYLEGGNPWTINTLTGTTLKMTSKYNLVVEATK